MSQPIRGEPATYRCAVRVTRTEYVALRRLARANSLTISALVGEAVACFAADIGEGAPITRTCCVRSLCAHRAACSTPARR